MNAVEGRAVNDGFVLALVPLAAMMNLTEIDAVLEKIGERTVSKGNGAVVFGDLSLSPLGNDAPAVQFGHQLAERL